MYLRGKSNEIRRVREADRASQRGVDIICQNLFPLN